MNINTIIKLKFVLLLLIILLIILIGETNYGFQYEF